MSIEFMVEVYSRSSYNYFFLVSAVFDANNIEYWFIMGRGVNSAESPSRETHSYWSSSDANWFSLFSRVADSSNLGCGGGSYPSRMTFCLRPVAFPDSGSTSELLALLEMDLLLFLISFKNCSSSFSTSDWFWSVSLCFWVNYNCWMSSSDELSTSISSETGLSFDPYWSNTALKSTTGDFWISLFSSSRTSIKRLLSSRGLEYVSKGA